jgi:hypothetical protein
MPFVSFSLVSFAFVSMDRRSQVVHNRVCFQVIPMRHWQSVAIYAALPLITLEVVLMGVLEPRHSPLLAGGLAALSLACGLAMLQVYRLRANPRAAFSLALIFTMAAGSSMLLLAARL